MPTRSTLNTLKNSNPNKFNTINHLPMGAIRQVRMVVDIMLGDRFFKTFRGMVDSHPIMIGGGECEWCVTEDDLAKAILAKYPSLENKSYQTFIV